MKLPFLRRNRHNDMLAAFYGAIVAQARAPAVYRVFEIPDTLEARFEVLVLHLVVALGRTEGSPPLIALGQGAFDMFCQDMDDHMREMGVGDLSVPKKMRRVADAFYGRQATYHAASSEANLGSALIRTVYGNEDRPQALGLARYVLAAQAALARQDDAEIAGGRLAWPAVAAI